ncbi:MAG: HlyD family secretion protein [Halioglobus sp.]|jgi:HlyD family secretion protein
MKQRLIFILILASLGGAYYAWSHWNQPDDNSALTLYGNVDIREVQLGFRVAGRLQEMHVEEGDAVAAGTLLAGLDSKPFTEALAVAEARVREAEARLLLVKTGSRPQEIQQAREAVKEAQAADSNAKTNLKRQQELVASKIGTQRFLDNASAQFEQTSARLAASKEALGLAMEGSRREDIAATEAGLAAAKAQREQFNTQLSDTQLYSPSAGIVMTRSREPGAMLGVGAPVYTLSLAESVYIRAYVDEPSLGLAVPGASVRIITDTQGKEYAGQIGFVSPRAEFTPKSVETQALRSDLVYRLRIVVTNADEFLRQGMPVTVVLSDS